MDHSTGRNIGTARKTLVLVFSLVLLLGAGWWAMSEGGGDSTEKGQATPVSGVKLPQPVRFVAVGDIGSGASMQHDVAREMIRLYERNPYSHVLILGDIIYPDGNVVKYGQSRYKAPYKPLMDAGVSFMPVLGNHDMLHGNVAQLLTFYQMPGRYYNRRVGDVEFFALDTNEYTWKEKAWLTLMLNKSTARWKVVYGHHPIYSSGEHGVSSLLRKELEPVLIKFKADIYLSGHDHDYERFAPVSGVNYIVSGGGGAYLRKFEKVLPNSLVRQSVNHFLDITVTPAAMEIVAIDKQGNEVDRVTIHKTAKETKHPAA
jgi:hypothetical protein